VYEWQAANLARGRVVSRGNLHVTLAFLGHRPRAELAAVADALRGAAAAASPIVFRCGRYRETRSVGMIELDDETGAAGALAADLFGRLEELGVYRREARPWLPHVTVLRFREPPRLRPAALDLGEVIPSDAALYHSVLRSSGAQYEVLETCALGGR
jgi:2'-5' RNA ligase